MVPLPALWLPILVAAVFVFVVSSIIHMVLGYHNSDYAMHPKEDELRAALRGVGVAPGHYSIPRPADMKDLNTPEMQEKYKEGPVAVMTVIPNGPISMGSNLVMWFVYCLLIGVFAAYVAGRALGPGAHYLAVFRFVGTVALVGYALGNLVDSIWKYQSWTTTAKHVADGIVYALVTAGVFGWLWPS